MLAVSRHSSLRPRWSIALRLARHLHQGPSAPPPLPPPSLDLTDYLYATITGVSHYATTQWAKLSYSLPTQLFPEVVYDWKMMCGVTVALCTGALLAENAWHAEWCIRRRMSQKQRSCTLPTRIHPTGDAMALIPHPHPPLDKWVYPTLLLGPPGCGKTTTLKALARGHMGAKSTPTLYIQLTFPPGEQPSMIDVANQLLPQIGYPTRRSYLSGFMTWFNSYSSREDATAYDLHEARVHVKTAMTLLFEEASALSVERMNMGMTPLQAAPILLLDGMQGLILPAVSWGEEDGSVLKHLGCLIAAHGLEAQKVRVILAGTALSQSFQSTNPGTQFNWHYHCMVDPAVDATAAALTGLGYTEGEAGRMISLAGTRVGLFGAVMATGGAASAAAAVPAVDGKTVDGKMGASPPVSEADFTSQVLTAAHLDFVHDLSKCKNPEVRVLLEAVWEGLWDNLPPPTLSEVKSWFGGSASPDFFATLYVNHLGVIRFKSQGHRNA